MEPLDIGALTQDQYDALKIVLQDTSSPMEKRLRAVFTLKSLKTNQAVDALHGCMWTVSFIDLSSLALGDPSVLLAHEVAYVMVKWLNEDLVDR